VADGTLSTMLPQPPPADRFSGPLAGGARDPLPDRFRAVLSRYQTRPLLPLKGRTLWIEISLDLGLTRERTELGPGGLLVPGAAVLPWSAIEEISGAENGCFVLEEGRPRRIQSFSAVTGRPCSLMPTAGAPALLVAGFNMHRIKDSDPFEDGRAKALALRPVRGLVLDTATGLGYSAMEAARTAQGVHTIELDPAVAEVAAQNPWSRGLFTDDRITRHFGDSFEVVDTFDPETFDRVIHDPPVISLAGALYSGEFYRKVHRVMAPGARMFHYVGDPDSAPMQAITRGVRERLRQAGFSRVDSCRRAFGLVAYKCGGKRQTLRPG